MSDFEIPWHRYATFAALTEKSNAGLGRTALMKMCYFLQVLRKVDLGYDFRLYTYGPFDSQVLDDLSYAEFLGAVDERVVQYPSGYGYIIKANKEADLVKEKAADFLAENETHIDWVVKAFGSCFASDLELMSTMVFVDREAAQKGQGLKLKELVHRVLQVKPHFAEAYALQLAERLQTMQAYRAVSGQKRSA